MMTSISLRIAPHLSKVERRSRSAVKLLMAESSLAPSILESSISVGELNRIGREDGIAEK